MTEEDALGMMQVAPRWTLRNCVATIWKNTTSEEFWGGLFCIYLGRVLIVPLWTTEHLPIISPVYKQGGHWLSSPYRTAAILVHVVLGLVMIGCAVHQLRMSSRTCRMPLSRHRWVGRFYAASGVGVVTSLQVLMPTLGQGPGQGPNIGLIAMAETSCALWLISMAAAIWHAKRGRIRQHRRCAALSFAVCLVPVTQRGVYYYLVPLTMLIQVLRGASWDTGEALTSADGWGRAGHEVLAVSAWAGLALNLFWWRRWSAMHLGLTRLHAPVDAKLVPLAAHEQADDDQPEGKQPDFQDQMQV